MANTTLPILSYPWSIAVLLAVQNNISGPGIQGGEVHSLSVLNQNKRENHRVCMYS